jgi:AhpD family alkylhydroperoxidase
MATYSSFDKLALWHDDALYFLFSKDLDPRTYCGPVTIFLRQKLGEENRPIHIYLDKLHKQLLAVAVALTTQCAYCIELHVKQAREAGATDQMLAEVATVAAAMRAGAAITHATHMFKDH